MSTNSVLTKNDAPTGTGCLMAVVIAVAVLAFILLAMAF